MWVDKIDSKKACKQIPGEWASLVAQTVKNTPAVQETQVQSLGWEDPLEKRMATHSSFLAWRIPMDRGAWWATVHWVAESRTRPSDSPRGGTSVRTALCPRCRPQPQQGPASWGRGLCLAAWYLQCEGTKLVWAASGYCLRFTDPLFRMTAKHSKFLPDPCMLSPVYFFNFSFHSPPCLWAATSVISLRTPSFPAPLGHITGCPFVPVGSGYPPSAGSSPPEWILYSALSP